MPSFPVNIQIKGRLAVIIGGGAVALRKGKALAAAGARLRVVAPQIDAAFDRLPDVQQLSRAYDESDLDGAFVVLAATGDADVNRNVCAQARRRNLLCSNASDPGDGDFTLPATVRIDDVTIAVDTGGSSPAFAKRIATELHSRLDPHYGRAAKTLGVMRDYVLGIVPPAQRAAVMNELSALPPERLAALNPLDAQHEVDTVLERAKGIETTAATQALVCATRASKLALTQTRGVAARLAQAGMATTMLTISTLGDQVQDRSLAAIGAESLFVKELELALRDGRANYAVHSCKDLPSVLPPDMCIAAVSSREDPRDAFCSERFESFASLPPGAKVGTSSMRRRAQLAALRPDLQYADIRGNVDTRLRKLRDGEFDAIVLAMAGLRRLGANATHTVPFEPDELVPAVGQGALAVEMLSNAQELPTLRAALNDAQTERNVTAERAALATLRGGCQAPIGIHATHDGETLRLRGVVVSADGAQVVRANLCEPAESLEAARALGERLAAQLIASGAESILGKPPGEGRLTGKRIVLPRTLERPSRIAEALEAEGASVLQIRSDEAGPDGSGEALPDMIVFPSSGSVEAARPLLLRLARAGHRPAVAAMGPASASAAAAAGFPPDVTAPEPEIGPLVAAVRAYLLSGGGSTP